MGIYYKYPYKKDNTHVQMNPYVPYPNIHIPNPDSYLSMIYPIYKENQAKGLSYLPILMNYFGNLHITFNFLYIACYKRNHTFVLTLNRVLKYFRVIYNCYDIKN